jgi:NADPH2:quinone reductase
VHGLWLGRLSQNNPVMSSAWRQLSQWIDAGRLRPVVGDTLPLEKVAEAYALLLERKNFGKVVLTIRSQ